MQAGSTHLAKARYLPRWDVDLGVKRGGKMYPVEIVVRC